MIILNSIKSVMSSFVCRCSDYGYFGCYELIQDKKNSTDPTSRGSENKVYSWGISPCISSHHGRRHFCAGNRAVKVSFCVRFAYFVSLAWKNVWRNVVDSYTRKEPRRGQPVWIHTPPLGDSCAISAEWQPFFIAEGYLRHPETQHCNIARFSLKGTR